MYRPGQNVHFRAILRNGTPGDYTIPVGTMPVTISVYDAGEHRLYRRNWPFRNTARFRAIYNSYASESGPLLHFNFGDATDNQRYYAGDSKSKPIRNPKRPCNSPSIDRTLIAGSGAQVRLSTQYLFGRPGAGMLVHYAVDIPTSLEHFVRSLRGLRVPGGL